MKRYQSNFLAATDVGYFALKQPLLKRSSSRIYKLGNGQVILNVAKCLSCDNGHATAICYLNEMMY